MGGATVWAGRRYFKRHDVHSLDWFYWNPAQGNTAVGVEDVNPGFGKLAFTVIKMEAGPTTLDLTRGVYVVPEIRAYDVPVNPDGTLEIGIDLAIAHDQKVAGVDALGNNRAGASPLFTIQHNQANLLGGSNTLAFQYGSGAFSKETGDGPGQLAAGGTTNDKQWRVIEHLVVNPTPEISSAFVLVYQDLKGANSAEAKSFTGEIRPAYQFTDNFKLAADLFYQSVKIDQGGASTTMNLTKLTLAPTIVLGRGYYARPELRFFVTYGSWNQGAVDLAAAQGTTMAGGAFGTTKNGTTVGAQLEIWF
jgi:maltoporin